MTPEGLMLPPYRPTALPPYRPSHRPHGRMRQLTRRGPVRGVGGPADAHLTRDDGALRRGRGLLAKHLAQLRGENRRAAGAHTPENHGELLGAVATDDVAGSDVGAEHVGDVEQDLVTHDLAEALVHLAEAVEVEHHERERATVAASVVHRVLKLRHQRAVAQQSGELIPEQHLAQPAAALRPDDDRLEQDLRRSMV